MSLLFKERYAYYTYVFLLFLLGAPRFFKFSSIDLHRGDCLEVSALKEIFQEIDQNNAEVASQPASATLEILQLLVLSENER